MLISFNTPHWNIMITAHDDTKPKFQVEATGTDKTQIVVVGNTSREVIGKLAVIQFEATTSPTYLHLVEIGAIHEAVTLYPNLVDLLFNVWNILSTMEATD